MSFGTEVGLGPGDIVLDWKPTPSPTPVEKDTALQFWASVYYGQMAVCITISVGTEVGLSLGYIVLDGDPAPLP